MDPKSQFDRAQQLFVRGEYQSALDELTTLDRTYPKNEQVMFARARCLQRLGRTDEAVHLCQSLANDFDNAKAKALLSRIVHDSGPRTLSGARSKRTILGVVLVATVAVIAGVLFAVGGDDPPQPDSVAESTIRSVANRPQPKVIRDDFDGEHLESALTFVDRKAGATLDLGERPGTLRLKITESASLDHWYFPIEDRLEDDAPRIRLTPPAEDWELTTRATVIAPNVEGNYHVGLMVRFADADMFYWGLHGQKGLQVARTGAQMGAIPFRNVVSGRPDFELKITKRGSHFLFYYRSPGRQDWHLLNQQRTPSVPREIGLFAKSWGNHPEVITQFDYVEARELPEPVSEPDTRLALALGWGDYADTVVPIDDLVSSDYTLSAWFMPQFPYAYAGPIFATNGSGVFEIGLGDYRWGGGDYMTRGAPVLYAKMGTETVTCEASTVRRDHWHHLAAVHSRDRVTLYLDGKALTPEARVSRTSMRASLGSETLRIGRGGDRPGEGYVPQFYGLVTDARAYRRALSLNEVARIARGGDAPPADWEFGPLRPVETARSDSLRLGAAARLVEVTGDTNWPVTFKTDDHPPANIRLQLPFAPKQAWVVSQAFDQPEGSHNGYASFCWDFVLAGKRRIATKGQTLYAAAPGTIAYVIESTPDDQDEGRANVVLVQLSNGLYTSYMHVGQRSFSTTYGWDGELPQSLSPDRRPRARLGRPIATVSDTGGPRGNYHLHFGVTNAPDLPNVDKITAPAVFVNYEASDDQGKNWYFVEVGMPRQGQWVRRLR